MSARLHQLVADFRFAPREWRALAVGLAAALAVICALGLLYRATDTPKMFSVAGEIRRGFYVPVLFSFAVLFSAGLGALWLAGRARETLPRLAWLGVGVLFCFMAFDELLMIHEDLEEAVGVDWQLLYLPVIAVGGLAWLLILTRLPRWSLGQVLWIAGGALWAFSQVLEKVQYDSDDDEVRYFVALNDTEKVVQFMGSCLFLLVVAAALIATARSAAAR